jgi:hypothetical protein
MRVSTKNGHDDRDSDPCPPGLCALSGFEIAQEYHDEGVSLTLSLRARLLANSNGGRMAGIVQFR